MESRLCMSKLSNLRWWSNHNLNNKKITLKTKWRRLKCFQLQARSKLIQGLVLLTTTNLINLCYKKCKTIQMWNVYTRMILLRRSKENHFKFRSNNPKKKRINQQFQLRQNSPSYPRIVKSHTEISIRTTKLMIPTLLQKNKYLLWTIMIWRSWQ